MEFDDGVAKSEGDSARSVEFLRSQWINTQMEERLEDFAEVHEVSVVCGTWNANGKNVPSMGLDLLPWLTRGVGASGPADVYAIGAQEMVDLTAVNVVTEGKSGKRAEAWCEMLEHALVGVGLRPLLAEVSAKKPTPQSPLVTQSPFLRK